MNNPMFHGPETNDQEIYDRWNMLRFNSAVVCERCKKVPPTDIMRYTSYCAVCSKCCEDLLNDMRLQSSREEI